MFKKIKTLFVLFWKVIVEAFKFNKTLKQIESSINLKKEDHKMSEVKPRVTRKFTGISKEFTIKITNEKLVIRDDESMVKVALVENQPVTIGYDGEENSLEIVAEDE